VVAWGVLKMGWTFSARLVAPSPLFRAFDGATQHAIARTTWPINSLRKYVTLENFFTQAGQGTTQMS
jgi:hypothetical protein